MRKEEYYDKNGLFNVLYYIEIGTSHQNLLSFNLDLITIIEIEDINLNYTKFHSYQYINNVLQSKSFSIRTKDDKDLMSQELNILTGLPYYNKTCKYYIDEMNGFEFEFEYHSSGVLVSIIVSNDSISFYEQYRPSELDLIPNFEWWSLYSSYYLNAEPAIPDGILIV
jgi:hypothetical protein